MDRAVGAFGLFVGIFPGRCPSLVWIGPLAHNFVGRTDLDSLCAYIDKQEEHHRTRTMQEEYRMFLEKYGVEYDEAYVWD